MPIAIPPKHREILSQTREILSFVSKYINLPISLE
jgi:hypothetical protein